MHDVDARVGHEPPDSRVNYGRRENGGHGNDQDPPSPEKESQANSRDKDPACLGSFELFDPKAHGAGRGQKHAHGCKEYASAAKKLGCDQDRELKDRRPPEQHAPSSALVLLPGGRGFRADIHATLGAHIHRQPG